MGRKRGNTREKILLSSIELMSIHGFQGVTYGMIAQEVGIRDTTIYHHYKNKEIILDGIIQYLEKMVISEIPTSDQVAQWLKDETPGEILRRNCFYPPNDQRFLLKLCRILYKESFTRPDIASLLHRLWMGYRDLLQHLLDYMIAFGAIPPADTRTLSALWARVRCSFSVFYIHEEHSYVSQYQNVVNMFLAMATEGTQALPVEGLTLPGRLPTVDLPPAVTTKEKILHSSFALFCEKGFEKTTIAEIATGAGTTSGNIYNHYQNKKAIIKAVIDTIKEFNSWDNVDDAFARYDEDRDIGALITALSDKFIVTWTRTDRERYRLIMHEQFHHYDIRFYYLGCVNKDRNNLARAIQKRMVNRGFPECDYFSLATIHVFNHLAINIENVVLDKTPADTEEYRLHATALISGALRHGIKITNDS